MVATGVMLSSFQNLAISIAVERDEGALKRLRATPLPAAAYFLGKIGQVLVRCVLQTALLLAVAALVFDVPMPTTPAAGGTFAWVFVLGTATGSRVRRRVLLGAALGPVRERRGDARSCSCCSSSPACSSSSTSCPSWMQQLASVFPLKWMAQGMRSVFLPDEAAALEPSRVVAARRDRGRAARVARRRARRRCADVPLAAAGRRLTCVAARGHVAWQARAT